MNLCDEIYAHSADRSLFGVPVQQNHASILLYERLLCDHPELMWIGEIGTGRGALSLYFGVWGQVHDIQVFTVDPSEPREVIVRCARDLGVDVIQGSCFSSGFTETLQGTTTPGLLFCDGGDKPREVATFAPLLRPGSIVIVHDYAPHVGWVDAQGRQAEITDADIRPIRCIEFYEPWHTESIELKAKSAILRRNHYVAV